MKREEILEAARGIVVGDRYGTPERNFETIAEMWSAYLQESIDPADVAAMMALVKIARISSGHGKADNWIDLAGYAACGGELEKQE